MIFKLVSKLTFIITLGTILRLIGIFIYGDTRVDNEWGIMLNNLENNNILSVRSVDGTPVPNIFMPPLYPFFLYLIKIFYNDLYFYLLSVQLIQLILSLISIYFTYKILRELFSNNYSLVGTFLFSIFPLNVYAVSQISSITLQIFLLNLFLFSFIKLFKKIKICLIWR